MHCPVSSHYLTCISELGAYIILFIRFVHETKPGGLLNNKKRTGVPSSRCNKLSTNKQTELIYSEAK